ncbi:hypothetical protein A7K91_18740 [Paenibacillus oryzae]|uniref:Uncharacterized protein n=1 Tax=Paenibacillus oryzae TaxID=1844972 RepID=A0A1A5YQS7_9BACL|nr:hypothetical protein A7K91_18740 [Paenibacillus oryzae]
MGNATTRIPAPMVAKAGRTTTCIPTSAVNTLAVTRNAAGTQAHGLTAADKKLFMVPILLPDRDHHYVDGGKSK